MTDQELRAMIRASIARHLGPQAEERGHVASTCGEPKAHPSHTLLPLARGGDADGMCLIEPSVRCTHCGYCLSYGH